MNIPNIELAEAVLNDYYATKVPRPFLQSIIAADEYLISEMEGGSIRDTYGRDLLINCITRKLGVAHWPTYRDSDEYSKDFFKMYSARIAELNKEILE